MENCNEVIERIIKDRNNNYINREELIAKIEERKVQSENGLILHSAYHSKEYEAEIEICDEIIYLINKL